MKTTNITKVGLLILILISMSFAPLGCNDKGNTQMDKKDIVDTAVSAGNFNTLVTAVKAAGLVETLKSKGPFTVFAPPSKTS